MTTSSGESNEDIYRRYVAATSEGPANRLFDLLDPHLPKDGKAIDLGCGTGRGTLHLLSRGLQVTAVDRESEGLDVLRSKLPDASKVQIVQSSFQDLTLSAYDVFVACYSLFFLPPSDFAEFWPKVAEAVRPGGVFAGEFLGPHDDWRERAYTVLTAQEVRDLFEAFELLYFEEEDKDGDTAIGVPKHWHLFHVIARKT
jgi:tellurite methyltransferase